MRTRTRFNEISGFPLEVVVPLVSLSATLKFMKMVRVNNVAAAMCLTSYSHLPDIMYVVSYHTRLARTLTIVSKR
ncbi:MAG TPA: hypothetical protein EYP33_02350 [Pyrodictium sp.]|nr:hypothetical protein [Pyrodictium sp.]